MRRFLLVVLGGCLITVTLIMLLVVGLLLYPVVQPYSPDRPIRYTRTLSPGFAYEDTVYFLLDYRVSRYRRPVWFIMPIERSPTVYFQAIYLYAWEPADHALTQLDVLRSDFPFPPRVSVNMARFLPAEEGIALAYQAGTTAEFDTQWDLRIWNPDTGTLRPAGTQLNLVTESSSAYQQHFADYRSPAADNPGRIAITDLRELLEGLTAEDWDLPRQW